MKYIIHYKLLQNVDQNIIHYFCTLHLMTKYVACFITKRHFRFFYRKNKIIVRFYMRNLAREI